MKQLILDTDRGPLGQRCARLYGTPAASVHDNFMTSTLSHACPPSWHLVLRLGNTNAAAYQLAVNPGSLEALTTDDEGIPPTRRDYG